MGLEPPWSVSHRPRILTPDAGCNRTALALRRLALVNPDGDECPHFLVAAERPCPPWTWSAPWPAATARAGALRRAPFSILLGRPRVNYVSVLPAPPLNRKLSKEWGNPRTEGKVNDPAGASARLRMGLSI